MQVTRKQFIKTASLVTGGLMLGVNNAFAKMIRETPGFQEIRDGVGIYTNKGGTMAWYISKDAAVVIDSQFPDSAEIFYQGFQERTKSRINILFNTHHHRDHTSGNYFLKNYVDKIVAQENCPKLQLKQNKGTENQNQQAYADTTFKTTWEAEVGNETISAQFIGAAHTGGDAVIHFQEANVVHMGDLVFNENYPSIDEQGGGSIEGWIDVLERASKRLPSDAVYIFGHAANNEMVIGKKNDLNKMRDYLSALMDYVKKEASSGKSLEEIKKAEFIPLHKKRAATRPNAVAQNLEAAYNELNKGKKENK